MKVSSLVYSPFFKFLIEKYLHYHQLLHPAKLKLLKITNFIQKFDNVIGKTSLKLIKYFIKFFIIIICLLFFFQIVRDQLSVILNELEEEWKIILINLQNLTLIQKILGLVISFLLALIAITVLLLIISPLTDLSESWLTYYLSLLIFDNRSEYYFLIWRFLAEKSQEKQQLILSRHLKQKLGNIWVTSQPFFRLVKIWCKKMNYLETEPSNVR